MHAGGAETLDPKCLGEAEIVEEGKVGDGELLYIKVHSSTMPTLTKTYVSRHRIRLHDERKSHLHC
jgi:hypothetical protein